ncbi:uncharacterized protein LOC109860580 [Pseudomyrmex gracilis]|uniref:uncharacterized protein LOC109860580 n=1 Tax=Pseudomyrmex gracilis TaxID=219809 RepID=UPI000994AD7B|nr:uncharacterized protein LOC109860580 [Pseudomyrmex gracilis]
MHMRDADVLFSLDVVSLFTNIPLDLALDGVRKRWDSIKDHTKIPLDPFIRALEFVLSSTFFDFNGITYQQTFGTPMGSPLSPIIVDIVLQDLETHCLNSLNITPPFYFRYVDDILMAAPREHIDPIFNCFNSYHPRLKFTIEIEEGRSINFLDTSISVINNKLLLNWYHKPTFSGRYLNFFSQHPLNQKIGIIYGIIDRAVLLSHPSFHNGNLIKAIQILLANDYPLDLIFKTVRRRLHCLFSGKLNVVNGEYNPESERLSGARGYFTLPFVSGTTDSISKSLKRNDFKLSFRILNTLRNFIKVHKDDLSHDSLCNVVYKINCSSCDASYVGQTSRQLRTRISEHHKNIYLNQNRQSVVSKHRNEFGHDFLWNEVEVLDTEHFLQRRLVSEMLNIKMQKNCINSMTDTELLDPVYTSLIEKFGS